MRILYLGKKHGTTEQRFNALLRLGHDAIMVDPSSFYMNNRILNKWIYETGVFGIDRIISKGIRNTYEAMPNKYFDFVFIDGGYLVPPDIVTFFKNRTGGVVNYNVDDPFSPREWRNWRLYRKSIKYYDLLVVVRPENIKEAISAGAKDVLHKFRSADEIVHKQKKLSPIEYEKWQSEVVFVGTWLQDRGKFMKKLIERGVPLSIWGDNWHKAKEWDTIKSAWRGPGIYSAEYAKPILGAKICLGLLSKENRDNHTQRSLEIPSLKRVFCGERTLEHLQLYEEGKEAFFWDSADECADICLALLKNPEKNEKIAQNGYERCLQNNHFNEPVLASIISHMKRKII